MALPYEAEGTNDPKEVTFLQRRCTERLSFSTVCIEITTYQHFLPPMGTTTLQWLATIPSLGALSSVSASTLAREEHSPRDGLWAVETWSIADSLIPKLRTETIVMGGQDWACFNGRAERMPSFCYPLLDVKRRYSKSILVACIDRGSIVYSRDYIRMTGKLQLARGVQRRCQD